MVLQDIVITRRITHPMLSRIYHSASNCGTLTVLIEENMGLLRFIRQDVFLLSEHITYDSTLRSSRNCV